MLEKSYGLVHPDWSPSFCKVLLGVLLGLYPLGQFIGAPTLGALSDRWGRKPVLLTSIALSFLMYIGIALSLTFLSIHFLLLTVFLAGLCEGNVGLAQGAIVDVVDDKDRSYYFGLVFVFSSSAYIVGPLLSSIFSLYDIVLVFWVVTLLLLITFLWTSKEVKETHQRSSTGRSYFEEFTNLFSIVTDKPLRYYYLVNFVIYMSIFGYFRVYAMYAVERFHVSTPLLSLIVAYVAVPIILFNTFATTRLSKLATPKKLTTIFSFLMGLFMILISIPEKFHYIWITLFLTTSAVAIVITFCATMLSFQVSKSRQGAVMGNNQSLQASAQGISAILGGLAATLAIWLPLTLFGFFGLIAGLLLINKK